MSNKMDRCTCWKKTQIVISVEHCPSALNELVKELEKVTIYAMDFTILERFGKVRISSIDTTDSPVVGD